MFKAILYIVLVLIEAIIDHRCRKKYHNLQFCSCQVLKIKQCYHPVYKVFRLFVYQLLCQNLNKNKNLGGYTDVIRFII